MPQDPTVVFPFKINFKDSFLQQGKILTIFSWFLQVQVCSAVPSFNKILKGKQMLSQEAWDILDWALDRTFAMKSVDKSKVPFYFIISSFLFTTHQCKLQLDHSWINDPNKKPLFKSLRVCRACHIQRTTVALQYHDN